MLPAPSNSSDVDEQQQQQIISLGADDRIRPYDTSIHDSVWYRVLATVQITMIVCGLIGNTLNMLAATLDRKLRSLSANKFVINLGVADLIVTTVTMPMALLGTLYGYNVLGESYLICEFVSTICTTACVASLSTVVIVSVNRYVALLKPHRYQTWFSHRNCGLLCLIPWLAGVGWALPLHYGWSRNTFDTLFTMCWFDRDPRYYSYRFARVFGMELIPIVIVFTLYLRMFLFIRRRKKAIDDETKAKFKSQINDIKLAKTLFIMFLAFLCTWILLAVVFLFDVDLTWNRAWHIAAVTMAHLGSSGVNFLLYFSTNSVFRRAYKSVLRKACNTFCFCCCQISGPAEVDTTTGAASSLHVSARGKTNEVSLSGNVRHPTK